MPTVAAHPDLNPPTTDRHPPSTLWKPMVSNCHPHCRSVLRKTKFGCQHSKKSSGKMECAGGGVAPPVSLAEFTLNGGVETHVFFALTRKAVITLTRKPDGRPRRESSRRRPCAAERSLYLRRNPVVLRVRFRRLGIRRIVITGDMA